MSLIDEQLKYLKEEYQGSELTPLPGGSHLITIPNVKLPDGWMQDETTVKFLILANYPHSAPDCFWVKPEVRLRNGALPKNSTTQIIPGTSDNWLWFSWHPAKWSPNRDTLSTYAKVIESRLSKPE